MKNLVLILTKLWCLVEQVYSFFPGIFTVVESSMRIAQDLTVLHLSPFCFSNPKTLAFLRDQNAYKGEVLLYQSTAAGIGGVLLCCMWNIYFDGLYLVCYCVLMVFAAENVIHMSCDTRGLLCWRNCKWPGVIALCTCFGSVLSLRSKNRCWCLDQWVSRRLVFLWLLHEWQQMWASLCSYWKCVVVHWCD